MWWLWWLYSWNTLSLQWVQGDESVHWVPFLWKVPGKVNRLKCVCGFPLSLLTNIRGDTEPIIKKNFLVNLTWHMERKSCRHYGFFLKTFVKLQPSVKAKLYFDTSSHERLKSTWATKKSISIDVYSKFWPFNEALKNVSPLPTISHARNTVVLRYGPGVGKNVFEISRGFIVSRSFSIYFTITGTKDIFLY